MMLVTFHIFDVFVSMLFLIDKMIVLVAMRDVVRVNRSVVRMDYFVRMAVQMLPCHCVIYYKSAAYRHQNKCKKIRY